MDKKIEGEKGIKRKKTVFECVKTRPRGPEIKVYSFSSTSPFPGPVPGVDHSKHITKSIKTEVLFRED